MPYRRSCAYSNPPSPEPIACPTYRNDVLSDTEAEASVGAAATRRTCCIELLEAKPRPQIAPEHAINGEKPAERAHPPIPASTNEMHSIDAFKGPQESRTFLTMT